ncbi:MAG: NAD(P)-dependent oxidoreductase [Pseudomonadota bacterium]
MSNTPQTPGVVAARLTASNYATNFSEMGTPLSDAEAVAAAEQCLSCTDAPCAAACPTAIDVPLFIRQIRDGEPMAAARTILDQNILGGMCARVCPGDTLCEGACASKRGRNTQVQIARLQRFATDTMMGQPDHPYERAPGTGRSVAVVGAGPAGLACAHRLAMLGHSVTLMDGRDKPGGLNEYGIAAYKSPKGFAQAEVDWLMRIGGITLRTGVTMGRDMTLDQLRKDYDAVFLGLGLAGVNALRTEGEDHDHVHDAVDFIAGLRQADGWSEIPVGRNVVVIGGGMTAVDAAVQAKLLGAEHVTMVYRRDEDHMGASEQQRIHARSKGVRIITGAVPTRILGDGRAEAVEFMYTEADAAGLKPGKETFRVPADQVFKAIGQHLEEAPGGLRLEGRKIAVTAAGQTSLPGVWAGGDCASAGASDLTVVAVAQGRDAADDIHETLLNQLSVAAE